ncbi:MAG: site-specific DNA-methyltransferase [Bifidobacteriaceae bacterium]|nr:site-specific DNA-methyltransferase [Bifidobacteriaceae bacterium]
MNTKQPTRATLPVEPARLGADPPALLYQGDVFDVLPSLAAGSFHTVVTDPPYAIGIDQWDTPATFDRTVAWRQITLDGAGGPMAGYRAWTRAWAQETRRVLKPGGWLICFGGARTWHHVAVGIEQAGFQIKDQIAWLYTSGVPKNLDLSNAIDQRLGYLRPDRRVGAPTAGLLPSRRVVDKGKPISPQARKWNGWGTALAPAFEPVIIAKAPTPLTIAANLLEHDTGAINTAAGHQPADRWPKNAALDQAAALILDQDCAARPGERSGLFPVFRHHPKATRAERPELDGGAHQTVKPLGLMRWLCTLFCPPDGVLLDPFAGSGATLEAAHQLGIESAGIELDPAHQQLIKTRFTQIGARPGTLI